MGLLHELGCKYGTDKAETHNFMNFYERYFETIRFQVTSILEIGVHKGESIRVWLDYFPNATVYGIDIKQNDAVRIDNPRFHYIIDDALNPTVINKFENNVFDIVIDDGCHLMGAQQSALKHYWAKIKPNGYFVMEDMHTSFWDDCVDVRPTTYEFLIDRLESNDIVLDKIRNEIKNLGLFHEPNNERIRNSHITAVLQK